MKRRHLICALGILAGGIAVHGTAAAQSAPGAFPSKPIRMIVAYPAGGPNDLVARIYAQRMSDLLGQPIVVESRAGAAGNIGAAAVAKAEPDGYTLLAGAGALTIAPALSKNLSYDVSKDFAPIGLMARGTFMLAGNPSVPAKTVQELIAYAKANPGKLQYASSGVGAPPHLAGELMKNMAGIDMVHVPYKGVGQSINDLLSGQVNLMFVSLPVALPHVKSGQLRAFGVSTATRSPLAPDIASLDEQGLKGFDISTWWGILAPAGTPPATVDRLSKALLTVSEDPEMRKVLTAQGLDVLSSTPEAFATHIASEIKAFGDIVRIAGITEN